MLATSQRSARRPNFNMFESPVVSDTARSVLVFIFVVRQEIACSSENVGEESLHCWGEWIAEIAHKLFYGFAVFFEHRKLSKIALNFPP